MKKRSRNFTLLELLTVISIIIIMMSLVLPSLQRAKQKSQEISCKGLLRQVGMGASFYSIDNDSWCVAAFPEGYYTYTWDIILQRHGYITSAMRYCPSEPIRNKVSYGLNCGTFGSNVTNPYSIAVKMHQVSRFNRDSSIIYFADTPPLDYKNIGVGFNSDSSVFVAPSGGVYPIYKEPAGYYPIYVRHCLRANAAIFDGHVESLNVYELRYNQKAHWNPYQQLKVLKILTF